MCNVFMFNLDGHGNKTKGIDKMHFLIIITVFVKFFKI